MSEVMNVGVMNVGQSANWAQENLLVANWAPADWASWRQIGPPENVGAVNWAPGKLGPYSNKYGFTHKLIHKYSI